MHPLATSERPSPATAAPASSPAPADAGQGVGTIHPFVRQNLEAERVLTSMLHDKFLAGDLDSPECEALTLALTALKDRIAEWGYRA